MKVVKIMSSLQSKLFFTYLLIGVLPLFFFFNAAITQLEEYHYGERINEITLLASTAAVIIADRNYLFDEELRPYFDADIVNFGNEIQDTRVLVLDVGAVVVGDSRMEDIGTATVAGMIINALEGGVATPGEFIGVSQIAAAAPIHRGDEVAGAVYIVSNVAHVREIVEEFQSHFINLIALISVVVIIAVWFAARLLIDPLRKIVKSVQVISDGQLSERINITSGDEFGELRDAFNHMTSQLEKIDANRQDFVSNVSHELRTPLSAIKVLSDSLLGNESADIESYREFMLDISSEVDRMNNIVNELLTLVNLEQGESVLNISKFSLNDVAAVLIKRLEPLADLKDIELSLEEVKQVTIEADEIKIGLAVSNLIENGIKYTPISGTVKVIADADHQHAFLTVQDTGIGIHEQDHAKIFNRFYRVDKTRSRETGGTGLGLSIAHKTVLLHHGNIKIISKENEGTSFVLRLPLKQE